MNVLAYPNAVEAYRTDQIKSIDHHADGRRATSTARTVTGAGGRRSPRIGKSSSKDGSSTGVIIGIAAAAVVLVGGGFLFALRRRPTAEDRE